MVSCGSTGAPALVKLSGDIFILGGFSPFNTLYAAINGKEN
jgi:hypothetical protein